MCYAAGAALIKRGWAQFLGLDRVLDVEKKMVEEQTVSGAAAGQPPGEESGHREGQARAETEPGGGAEQGETESVEGLELLLEDARNKADEHWNELLRARAELENIGRRAQRDLENAHKYALEKFTQELLPVADSLELAIAASSGDGEEIAKLREGVELTLKMLKTAMGKFGITEVNPEGEKFNPEFHQAMSMQEAADREPDTVIAVFQKGYLLNERLIRPAMVIVSKRPQAAEGKIIDEKA